MGAYGSKRFKAELESLRQNDPTLTVLNYESAGLGDEGARALAEALRGNETLRRLRLGQSGLSALGLQRICRALCDTSIAPCHLRRLDLSSGTSVGNAVGDNGAKCLAALLTRAPSLRHLTAGGCGIGDEGASSIAQALARNRTLKTLDLSNNSISDIGGEELGTALTTNSTLVGLSLWKNRVFHSGAEGLANGLATSTSLTWLGLGCNYIGDEGVRAISIALISNARDSGLLWLALGGNQITDRGAEHIGVALRAQRHNERRHRASRLSSSRIREPDDPFDDTDAPFEDVESETSLKERIRGGGLRPILELGVTPSHISMLLEGGGEDVEGVDGGEEDEEGEEEGKGEKKKEEEGEEGEGVFCLPLESLGLGGNKIGDIGAQHLASALASNTRLLSLGLADNCVRDEGASSLADLLRQTGYLQRLLLSGNEVADEGGSKLVAALTQNTSLKALYLARNPLGDEVGRRCLEVIGRHNNTLETLDIHDTLMTTPTINKLVETMRSEGVLRLLGSQPLPVGVVSETEPHLPPSGNVLDVENWRPKIQDPILRTKTKGLAVSTAPSNRQTTLEALGSLPPPSETAQSLVMRAGLGGGGGVLREGTLSRGRKWSRRSSVTGFLKRKLSLSRGRPQVRDSSVRGEEAERHRASWRPSSADREREGGTGGVWRGTGGGGEGAWQLGTTSGGFTAGRRRSRMAPPIELQPLIEDPLDEMDSGMFRSSDMAIAEADLSTSENHHHHVDHHNMDNQNMEHHEPRSYLLSASPSPNTTSLTSPATPASPTGVGPTSVFTDDVTDNGSGSSGMERRQRGLESGREESTRKKSDVESGHGEPTRRQSGLESRRGEETRRQRRSGVWNGGMGMEGGGDRRSKRSPRDSLLDSVPRESLLHSLTTDRPHPPANRRPPSRDRSPSPSPLHLPSDIQEEQEEQEEERNVFASNSTSLILAMATPIHITEDERLKRRKDSVDTKPLKEQWFIALRKRVGILKMGGFLHSGFQTLSSPPSSSSDYTIARLPRNISKCRPGAPLPPTSSRVKLQLVFEEVGSDFINASYLGRPPWPREFIATQLPLQSTVSDFWRMMWEQRVSVAMVLGELGGVVEMWPGEGAESRHSLVVNGSWQHGALSVTGIQEYPGTIPTLTVHQFSLTSSIDSETDYLTLYHFTGWPDGGVPQTPRLLSSLVHLLLAARQQQAVPGPVCVMSTNGGGRSGCLCALACAYQMMTDPIPEPPSWEPDQNILDQVIRGLRKMRGGLVATQRQFECLHLALETMVTVGMGGGGEGEEEGEGQQRKGKKKSKRSKGNKKKEKTSSKRSKKQSVGRGKRGGGESLLPEEEEGSVWDDQLRSQMMMF